VRALTRTSALEKMLADSSQPIQDLLKLPRF
jgi:hypothetical protein